MINPWARVLLWAVVLLFALLVLSIFNAASASSLIIEENTVTMSKEDFNKLTTYLRSLESNLNRASNKSIMWQELYETARSCVQDAAAAGIPVTPCFNLDNEQRSMTGEFTHPNITSD